MLSLLRIAAQVAILILYWKAGLAISQALLPALPGAVIGFFLLLASLASGLVRPEWFEAGTRVLLADLMLLFVPINVGIMEYAGLLRQSGLVIVAVIVTSTVATMLASGFVAQKLARAEAE